MAALTGRGQAVTSRSRQGPVYISMETKVIILDDPGSWGGGEHVAALTGRGQAVTSRSRQGPVYISQGFRQACAAAGAASMLTGVPQFRGQGQHGAGLTLMRRGTAVDFGSAPEPINDWRVAKDGMLS